MASPPLQWLMSVLDEVIRTEDLGITVDEALDGHPRAEAYLRAIRLAYGKGHVDALWDAAGLPAQSAGNVEHSVYPNGL